MFKITENHWFIYNKKLWQYNYVYGSCYGIVVLENRGYLSKVFTLMGS